MKKIVLLISVCCLSLLSSAAILNVASGNDLNWQIANAHDGDTICITTNDTIEWKYDQEIPVVVTMMPAQGITPTVKLGGKYTVSHNLTVKGITFIGISSNEFFRVTSGTDLDLTFDGCTFKNFHYAIRVYSADIQVNKLTVNNCIFDTYDSYAVYAVQGNTAPSVVKEFKLTNSTIMNGGSNPAIYISDNDKDPSTDGPVVLIDHCTLYNNASANYTLYLYKIGAQATISNSIVSNPIDKQASYAYYGYDGNFVNNCIWYNCTGGARSGSVTTNLSNVDPLFVNPADGNFTLQPTSSAIGAATDGTNLGDPRWGVQANEFSFVMSNPAADIDATDSYTISWTALDPSNEATITLEYSIDNTNWTTIASGIASNVYSYVWNFRGTMEGGTYFIRGTMANTTESKTSVATGKLTIVPDVEAPRAVRSLYATPNENTLTLSWINPDVPIPFVDTISVTPTVNASGTTSATITAENDAWKVDFVSSKWEQTGVKFAVENLNDMTGELTFDFKGTGGYQVLAIIEENNFDWWYKSFTMDCEDFTTTSFDSWKNLDWHNSDPTAPYDGNNVTAIYFVVNDAAETSEGTFYVKNIQFAGAVPVCPDYTKTIVRVSEVDFPQTPTDGTSVYEGTDTSCTYAITAEGNYFFSVFTQDDLGNTSNPITLNYPKSRWATNIENLENDTKVVKLIQNGQVVIIRDNKMYNILGAEM